MRTTLSINRAHPASSIQDASWTSRLDQQNGARRAAIYCHPNVSTMLWVATNPSSAYSGQQSLVHALAGGGYTVGASDLGFFNGNSGNGSVGNPAEQVRIKELAAWAKTSLASGGLGGSSSAGLVEVAVSAGSTGVLNVHGSGVVSPAPAAPAALVIVLPPWDLRDIYLNNRGGIRPNIEYSLGITYAGSDNMPANSSPKDAANVAALAGVPMRIYYATDDPLNGAADVAAMVAAYGPATTEAISVGALGHTEAAIAAINKPDLIGWLHDVAPPA